MTLHRAGHHNSTSRLALPATYQHPKTGLRVEVDDDGVTTFDRNGRHGRRRAWQTMAVSHEPLWTPEDEIGILKRAGWTRL